MAGTQDHKLPIYQLTVLTSLYIIAVGVTPPPPRQAHMMFASNAVSLATTTPTNHADEVVSDVNHADTDPDHKNDIFVCDTTRDSTGQDHRSNAGLALLTWSRPHPTGIPRPVISRDNPDPLAEASARTRGTTLNLSCTQYFATTIPPINMFVPETVRAKKPYRPRCLLDYYFEGEHYQGI